MQVYFRTFNTACIKTTTSLLHTFSPIDSIWLEELNFFIDHLNSNGGRPVIRIKDEWQSFLRERIIYMKEIKSEMIELHKHLEKDEIAMDDRPIKNLDYYGIIGDIQIRGHLIDNDDD